MSPPCGTSPARKSARAVPLRPRRFVLFGHVAPRAGRSGATAGAGMLTFPWSIGMAFIRPAAVLVQGAFHGCQAYPDFCHESSLGPISITPRGPKGYGQTRRVSSVLTARRAAPSDEYAQAGSRRRVFLAVSWVTDLGCHRVKKGECGRGDRYCEVVQRDQRIRIYRTRQRRQRCIRAHLSRGESWPEQPQ